MSGGPAEYPLHDVWGGRGGGFLNPSPPALRSVRGHLCMDPKRKNHRAGFGSLRGFRLSQQTKNSADSVEGERGGADDEIKDKDEAAAG